MTALAIPGFETERLCFAAPSEAILPFEAAFFASPRSHYVGGPLPRRRIWRQLALYLGHWALRGYGYWALHARSDGRPVGLCGIWHPREWPEPEIAYHLYNGEEGQGFATEAVRAVRDYAYDTLGWTAISSFIDPENGASVAVAERVGARPGPNRFVAEPGEPEIVIWQHISPEERP